MARRSRTCARLGTFESCRDSPEQYRLLCASADTMALEKLEVEFCISKEPPWILVEVEKCPGAIVERTGRALDKAR